MKTNHEYSNKCWWCGNEDLTYEHKYKQSDTKQEFGGKQFKGDDAIIKVADNREQDIQGINSGELKFQKNLCKTCNNSTSSPFDKAYEKFSKFVKANEVDITQKLEISLLKVYGNHWLEEKELLIKYYLKHICCRLVDNKFQIPQNWIDYLNGKTELRYLTLDFKAKLDRYELIKYWEETNPNSGYLGIGPLQHQMLNDEFSDCIFSTFEYRWLMLYYKYDFNNTGVCSNFDTEIINLESEFNVPPDRVRELAIEEEKTCHNQA